MDKERSAVINLGGEDYTLILTTRATKEISLRYGGLDKLGEKLKENKNMEDSLTEVVWLIMTLANQSILIHNLKDKEHPRELLTEDMVELLTSPADMANYNSAIMEAMHKGTHRNIESEDDPKNAQVG